MEVCPVLRKYSLFGLLLTVEVRGNIMVGLEELFKGLREKIKYVCESSNEFKIFIFFYFFFYCK